MNTGIAINPFPNFINGKKTSFFVIKERVSLFGETAEQTGCQDFSGFIITDFRIGNMAPSNALRLSVSFNLLFSTCALISVAEEIGIMLQSTLRDILQKLILKFNICATNVVDKLMIIHVNFTLFRSWLVGWLIIRLSKE